jgi:WD40 repeat protein
VHRRLAVSITASLAALLVVAPSLASASTGSWTATANMLNGRHMHTSVLSWGKVLVAGGETYKNGQDVDLADAELYDPQSATWSATGSMWVPRESHTMTTLPEPPCNFICAVRGLVLVTGGFSIQKGNTAQSSAEVYDPASGTWSLTGSMSFARMWHTATVVDTSVCVFRTCNGGGRVLVVGGGSKSAELYDPQTGSWTLTGSTAVSHWQHTATLLPDGKVLVAGGGTATAEVFDPKAGTWSTTGSMLQSRQGHTATPVSVASCSKVGCVLQPRVLVVGGDATGTAELYNPATGTWYAAGSLAGPRTHHTATLLDSGQVLVAGGRATSSTSILATAEIYDPLSGHWTATPAMTTMRENFTATPLPNGQVLAAGGFGLSIGVRFADLFAP